MAKKMKTRKGKDNINYPYTSPDLVIDSNGESQTTKNTNMKTDIDGIKADLGTDQLSTTAQNIKGAINEVNKKIGTGGTAYDDTAIKRDINDLKTTVGTVELTTTAKDLKGAVNEVNTQCKDIASKIENGNLGINIEPLDNDIPKVFFYGNTSSMSKAHPVDLNFEYKSKTATYKGVATIKWQGSSSLSFPKKNYTIKLFTDSTKSKKLKLNMKNWGKQSKFVLKANWIDTLHIRNISGARIAYDMIKSRSDFSSLPTELQQAPRCGVIDGFPIKVYINGELMGLYTWNIPKDKWCSNMDDTNPNHAFLMAEKNNGGSRTDNLTLACEFRANATIFADTSTAQYPDYDWVVEGPGDDVSADIRTSFNNLINCVKDTDDAAFKSTISNFLDLTSAFDYYCFAYLVCHYDGLGKNLGMATYDGTKWFCTLYDMDSIYGAKIDGSGYLETNKKCPEQYQETNSLLWQRIEECFGQELYTRYKELRQGPLSLGNIFTHAEEIYDSIPDRLYNEDRVKWPSLPSVDTNTIKRMRDYMIARATYVDGEMRVIGTARVACTNITLNNTTLSFTTTDTQTLTATLTPPNTTDTVKWSVNPAGIVTVNNGVVTPILDGQCTITATCGTKSATCNVTVTGVKVNKPCTNIILNNSTLTLTNKTPQTLIATLTPTDTTDEVIWTVNPIGICTVDNGVVTAIKDGNCVVTATCGTKSATCNVTVTGIEEPPAVETTLTKNVTRGKGLDKNTGELTDASTTYGTCEEYIPVIKGNTYTIQACGSWICICGYNSDKTFNKLITGGSVSATSYQFTNDCDYIRIGCTCTSDTNTTITITGVFDK